MNQMESRSGKTATQAGGYLAFLPNPLPPHPALNMDEEVLLALSAADRAVGALSSFGDLIPGTNLFVAMYVRREALLSSEIEGIACTLEDVLKYEEAEEQPKAEETPDITQVVNYVRAFGSGIEHLRAQPFSLELIRSLHKILLAGSPRGDEQAGNFRENQNWIGPKGSTVTTAHYVPPPVDHMRMSLGNFEYYVRDKRDLPLLIRCALAHAQFETIHPFSDGNGRIGRLLVPLMLAAEGVLRQPLLYLSLYLLENRAEYYERLMAIRRTGDWEGWLEFFLTGVRITAEDAMQRSKIILALYDDVMRQAASLRRSAAPVAETLFAHPIITTQGVRKHTGLAFDTARQALEALASSGIVKEITGQRRGRTYVFERYIKILRDSWAPDARVA
jgi:Fic family protein